MKVVVLTSHSPSLLWFRMDMMRSFVKAGCTVTALGNEREENWKELFEKEGIKYRQIIVQRNGTNPFRDLETLKSIKNMLREEKPDCVFCYQAKTVIYGAIAAHRLGIQEIYPLIAGVGSVFMGQGMKNRVVRGLLSAEYKLALSYAKRVFFQNKDDSEFFVGHAMVDEDKIVYLKGSGVNTEEYIYTPLPPRPTFLFIGRLIRDKGIYEYLEACRRVRRQNPNVRCMLVGPYDTNPTSLCPEELKVYVDEGSVEFFGEQRDVRPYLAQCSVFVLPSYREGTPKTVLEAMACGRAVITTDAPGCRETVDEGANGYRVKPRDIDSLVEKMLHLSDNPTEVYTMGVKGRKMAEEIFDVNGVNAVIRKTMNIT